jgi:hypothetical protein
VVTGPLPPLDRGGPDGDRPSFAADQLVDEVAHAPIIIGIIVEQHQRAVGEEGLEGGSAAAPRGIGGADEAVMRVDREQPRLRRQRA